MLYLKQHTRGLYGSVIQEWYLSCNLHWCVIVLHLSHIIFFLTARGTDSLNYYYLPIFSTLFCLPVLYIHMFFLVFNAVVKEDLKTSRQEANLSVIITNSDKI